MLSSTLSSMFCGSVTYNTPTRFSFPPLHLIPGKFYLQFQLHPNWWHTHVWLLPGYPLSALSKCLACLLDSISTISSLQLKYNTEEAYFASSCLRTTQLIPVPLAVSLDMHCIYVYKSGLCWSSCWDRAYPNSLSWFPQFSAGGYFSSRPETWLSAVSLEKG